MTDNNNDLAPIVIDLTVAERGEVTESWLAMLGGSIQMIMKAMFGGSSIPVKVKGNRRQVRDFAKTMASEKSYIKSAAKYGLNDPRVYKDKFKLRRNIRKFESSTGLKWPFR